MRTRKQYIAVIAGKAATRRQIGRKLAYRGAAGRPVRRLNRAWKRVDNQLFRVVKAALAAGVPSDALTVHTHKTWDEDLPSFGGRHERVASTPAEMRSMLEAADAEMRRRRSAVAPQETEILILVDEGGAGWEHVVKTRIVKRTVTIAEEIVTDDENTEQQP